MPRKSSVKFLPASAVVDVADELLADVVGVRVRVADALGVHDDHEVGAGRLADALGVRLQDGARIGVVQCVQHGGGGGDRERDVEALGAGIGPAVLPCVEPGQARAAHDDDQHDEQLPHEHLPCDGTSASPGHPRIVHDPGRGAALVL